MKTGGHLVISLDFELMWGMFDKVSLVDYEANIMGVETALPALLELFKKHDIHATWATVGMLMCNDLEDLEAQLPEIIPHYRNPALSAYEHANKLTGVAAHAYFAPHLVRQIIATPGQELASHTFSHYYCLEDKDGGEAGGEGSAFAADCAAMQKIFERFGGAVFSIVFPRNQWSPEALSILTQSDITAYRGTEDHWLYRARTEADQSNLFIRALRLLDHYVNLSGHHTYPLNQTKPVQHLVLDNQSNANELTNIPASRFLRPYSRRLSLLEPLRLRRIKRAMTHAAEHGEVFHLWWHPHNFGANQTENFKNLCQIIHHFAYLKDTYGMESANMAELANEVSNQNQSS